METALPDALTRALALSIDTRGLKKGSARSGSIATSRSGETYAAGSVASQTHLLDIPSELAALVRATHHQDYAITSVDTMVSDPGVPVSPLALKILADHAARTGVPIRYALYAPDGRELFTVADAQSALPFYRSGRHALTTLAKEASRPTAMVAADENVESQLKKCAFAGMTRNFPTREGASGYGAAVLAGDDTIYFGGQYSTFEERLGVHAEMGVLLHALMSGVRDISHMGIVSSKFPDTSVAPCGACRQFIAEVCQLYGMTPAIWCFASVSDAHTSHSVAELLPAAWSSTL